MLRGQTMQPLGLVNRLAMRAIQLPPEAREAFIKAEVARLREDFLSDAGFNPTMIAIANNFADRLAEWLPALAEMMETSDEGFAKDGWWSHERPPHACVRAPPKFAEVALWNSERGPWR
jgi:hypothetical protein